MREVKKNWPVQHADADCTGQFLFTDLCFAVFDRLMQLTHIGRVASDASHFLVF